MRPADGLWQRDTGHVDMQNLWRVVEYEIWVANSTLEELRGEVVVRLISVKTGEDLRASSKHEVAIGANGTTEVLKETVKSADDQDSRAPYQPNVADPFLIWASLYIQDKLVASDFSWPDPIKYLTFDERGIDVSYLDGNTQVVVAAAKPVKGFVFAEKEGVRLTDNGFDIMPGEMRTIKVRGCAANELKWRYVGM